MESMGPCGMDVMGMFEARVIAVCGDLGHPKLGLTQEVWDFLANKIDTVFHNGATVNYLFNYDLMRDANVLGTNEVVRLAFEGRPKEFNYVSTTFVFGWAVKSVLNETDLNENMELLDFGYSQSKWVAEQVVVDARGRGLSARIFRPALVSPSVTGGGNNFDIAVRLVAFMVNHGIGVDTLNQVSFVPADIVANNIVAISTTRGTANKTYHVTRDDYSNMMDITGLITKATGRRFETYLFATHHWRNILLGTQWQWGIGQRLAGGCTPAGTDAGSALKQIQVDIRQLHRVQSPYASVGPAGSKCSTDPVL